MFSFKMEYRWIINRTGTLPDGHTPDLTITHEFSATTPRSMEPVLRVLRIPAIAPQALGKQGIGEAGVLGNRASHLRDLNRLERRSGRAVRRRSCPPPVAMSQALIRRATCRTSQRISGLARRKLRLASSRIISSGLNITARPVATISWCPPLIRERNEIGWRLPGDARDQILCGH